MSSASKTNFSNYLARNWSVREEGLVHVGVLCLAAIALVTQLDAIGNTAMGSFPVSIFELLLVAVVGIAILIVARPGAVDARRLPADRGGLKLIAVLILWLIICVLFSEHKDLGFSYMIRMQAVLLLPILIACYLRNAGAILAVIAAIIVAGLANGTVMIYESFTSTRLFATSLAATEADFDGVIRSSGASDLNPTSSAQMLVVSTVMAAGLLASGFRKAWPILLVIIAIGCAGVALTAARSAIIGLGFGFGLILLSFYRHRNFPLIILVGIVGAIGALFLLPETTLERFASIANFNADRSLFRRLTYLRIGSDLLMQSPIWGVGPGNFPQLYLDETYRFFPNRPLNPRELHNTFLDMAVELGMVGFLLCATLLAMALRGGMRAFAAAQDPLLRQCAFAITVALAALMLASFFMPHKDFRYLWILVGLGLQVAALTRMQRSAR